MLTGRMNAPIRICLDLLMLASSVCGPSAGGTISALFCRQQLSIATKQKQITKSGEQTGA
jgi:hypothetical protein